MIYIMMNSLKEWMLQLIENTYSKGVVPNALGRGKATVKVEIPLDDGAVIFILGAVVLIVTGITIDIVPIRTRLSYLVIGCTVML